MTRAAIVLSKILISVLTVAGLLTQIVLLPVQASDSARLFPEVAFLQVPILTLGILFVACGQVVLASTWALLSLVARDAIFSTRSFRYVDVMIASLLVAVGLVFAVLVIMAGAGASHPGVFYPGVAAASGCAALALVLVVMRGLLAKASEQERYLEEVV